MAGIVADYDNPTMADLLTPKTLEERGRKRRKSEDAAYQPAAHNPSGESTTLRGRGRRRSASGTSLQSDDTNKPPPRTGSPPPRKYQRKTLSRVLREKKRSQSPFRSRSRDRNGTPRRRRQRTTTRSRSHEANKCSKRILKREESDNKKGKGDEP